MSDFNSRLDEFESIMHTLDDSQRPHHDTLINPPDPNAIPYDGWSTEDLRYYVYLRHRSRETYGPEVKDIPGDEKRRFIEQVKQEFLAERKAAVSKRTSEE